MENIDPFDPVGKKTLEVISNADRFNAWMYSQIKPYIKGRVLEVGSGIGNISNFILNDGFYAMLSDFNPEYCATLSSKFETYRNFEGVQKVDLVHPEFDSEYKELLGRFDAFIALNVVEHIEDDRLAIRNAKKLVREEGGRLIILVPSYNFLFSKIDENLGHFRRYTLKRLANIFDDADLHIIHRQYFNLAGILGWFISSKIARDEEIGEGNMKLFNILVPVFKQIDNITFQSAGLSSIMIGETK